MTPNLITAENARPGTPRVQWDLPAGQFAGQADLQGFVDGFSVDRASIVTFKIGQAGTRGWRMEIYRLGWYQGHGARLVATIQPTAEQMATARNQPPPANCNPGRTLVSADCSAWRPVRAWRVPDNVPSGVFLAKLIRTDNRASHILFVVRDDARHAAIRVMLSDMTWQAYNAFGGLGDRLFGGNSLYYGAAVNQYHPDCAQAVSMNRPIVNRGAVDRRYGAVQWSTFFTGEYPTVRWLERNGYDVAYMAGLDAAGSQPINAKVAMIIGHNEYWTGQMKDVVLAHLKGGNHLVNMTGNGMFWRTSGERQDFQRRPRVMVGPKGPDGTWRAQGEPENDWAGTIFAVNGPTLRPLIVSPAYAQHRLWRHCGIEGGWTSPPEILGFEWDTYGPEGVSGPAGKWMATPGPAVSYASDTAHEISGNVLQDAGWAYGDGTVHHRLVWVDRANGGITLAIGTINWAFGLDNANVLNKTGGDNTSKVIQQATVNALADMKVLPGTPQPGMIVA